MKPMADTTELVGHLFRHEAGKITAILSRLFGLSRLDLAEDAVQDAFLQAVKTWPYQGIPDNPAAWLMRVARNKAIDFLRQGRYQSKQALRVVEGLYPDESNGFEEFFHSQEIADSQLQLVFACCHPSLSADDQLAFTLKTVSGFGSTEIAKALLTSEAVIQKRLYRAKTALRRQHIELEIPAGSQLPARLDAVYTVLYLIFNEGYNSVRADELIRKDICAEAMRLCKLLSEHPCGQLPTTYALLSLMCFQASRLESRLDKDNTIVLLEQQDRDKWEKALIDLGYQYLGRSSAGKVLSIFHLEAAIAAEHALSPSFAATNWQRLLQWYDLLLEQKETPVVMLNRAVVLSRCGNPDQAIEAVMEIPAIMLLLDKHYIYASVLGDLYLQANNFQAAAQMLTKAYGLTGSVAEKKLIASKLAIANSRN